MTALISTGQPITTTPKVTVGMPVYNGETFIREALDSLLAQTYTDFELIISDNASTDSTEAICSEYASYELRGLALGTLINGLLSMPTQLVFAYGWTTLPIRLNVFAVAILVPAMAWAVSEYGAIGAAWIWVTLNTGYLVFGTYFLHRRLLPTEKWRWYRQDILIPLGAAAATASLCRWAVPNNPDKFIELAILLLSYTCTLTAATLAAPLVRYQVLQHMPARSHLLLRGRNGQPC